MANLTVFCQIKVRWKWRSVIFLVIVFLSEVKRNWGAAHSKCSG